MKILRRTQRERYRKPLTGRKAVDEIWLSFNLFSQKARAWESLQMLRACYLYQIRFVKIARRAKCAYKTVQRFKYKPLDVGAYNTAKIVVATKTLMAERILEIGEDFETTWNRWHECDPRLLPKNLWYTLKHDVGNTLGVKEPSRGSTDPKHP